MAALRAGKSDTTSSTPEIVKSSYTPIGKVDIAAIRAQAKEQQQFLSQKEQSSDNAFSYVGTTGYTPVQLPKPKPITSNFGGGSVPRTFGTTPRSATGTIAPMPNAPIRESKVIGGASKNFAADASGKTPSQLWAERKARERGSSGVTPDIAPQTPLPTLTRAEVAAVKPPGTYVEDSAEVIGKPVSGGVAAMRERFARQSLDEEQPSLPISPGTTRPPPMRARESPTISVPKSPPIASSDDVPSPPPVALGSKPTPSKTYQSIDDIVAAGAGAGVGLGVGAMAGKAFHHDEPEEEEHEVEHSPPSLPAPPQQETWDTTKPAEVSEDEEDDNVARQRSQIYAEQEHEPEHYVEDDTHEGSHHYTETSAQSAQSGKTAIVLFDYEAQEDNEINLSEGQIITEIEFIDDVYLLTIS
jgi:hypothetical protein